MISPIDRAQAAEQLAVANETRLEFGYIQRAAIYYAHAAGYWRDGRRYAEAANACRKSARLLLGLALKFEELSRQ